MIRLAVRLRPALAEVVLAELTVLAPNGVEEDRGPGYVEYAIYGAEGELPDLGSVRALAGDELVDVSATQIPDDWADRWQDFHQPILVAKRLWVRPSWAKPRAGCLNVVIDPGRAFGTGAHATTRLCLELLVGLAEAGEADGALADLGTGSGVLSIAAAKLGFGPLRAYDHEAAALEAAAANAAENAVEIELRRVNLREEPPELAPTVVANLTAPILLELAAGLGRGPLPRRFLCSGVLQSEEQTVIETFGQAGLSPLERRSASEWTALLFAPSDQARASGSVRGAGYRAS